MSPDELTAIPFAGRSGKGVRVAVIDSGVNVAHSHVLGVAGGVTIGETVEERIYLDLLGHGTAVMAAIQEKAPAAEYYAVRVFCSSLRTRVEYLLRSIEWSLDHGIHVINLSLGTMNAEHAARFVPLVERAAREGAVLVAAREAGGQPAYPGVLPGVIAAAVDWSCPREYYRALHCGKEAHFWASGYPRPLPGKPQELNLHGISFAVANMSGFVVRACEGMAVRTRESVITALLAESASVTEPAAR